MVIPPAGASSCGGRATAGTDDGDIAADHPSTAHLRRVNPRATRVEDVIEIEQTSELVDPVVIAAFEGWNDAADASSAVVDHLMKVWSARVIGEIGPEDYYDFQVNRPYTGTDERGMRRITWPTTRIAIASPPELDHDVILVRGLEPNMRWRQFCAELLAALEELGGTLVVTLGALLADTPHTRPIPVSGTSTEPEIVDRLKLEISSYEGPTGIVGVFQDACVQADVPAVSYWAAVPHYVAQPPCPKATLALVTRLEELLEVSIPLDDLPEDARAWERGVNELAEEDEDVAEYVRALEEARDTTDLPEASGEAIAREFERYLKRRQEDN
jgi:proteasome assembly chaperone (PAC2) family protein